MASTQRHANPGAPSTSGGSATASATDWDIPDAGNKASDYYRRRMSPSRFWLREKLLPIVRSETPKLFALQKRFRSPILDKYFLWTANLGSHTFYMLMLPLPRIIGYTELSRDLVFVLGMGIVLLGAAKDFLCLPRPLSPPLVRITMSGYTTKEYGFPSAHSGNAAAASLLLTVVLLNKVSELGSFVLPLFGLVVLYLSTIIFGRLYCGMHGHLDVYGGAVIGAAVTILRLLSRSAHDAFVFSGSWAVPLAVPTFGVLLLFSQAEPVDPCPCFVDSVSFMGVLIGQDIADWVSAKYLTPQYFACDPYPATLPFSYGAHGVVKVALRFVVTGVLVVLWKSQAKPVVVALLRGAVRALRTTGELRGMEIAVRKHLGRHSSGKSRSDDTEAGKIVGIGNSGPKSQFSGSGRPRSQSLAERVQELLVPEPQTAIGPQTASDVREVLAYRAAREARDNYKNRGTEFPEPIPQLDSLNAQFASAEEEKKYLQNLVGNAEPPKRLVQYDVEAVARLIIYGVIPCICTIVCSAVFPFLGI